MNHHLTSRFCFRFAAFPETAITFHLCETQTHGFNVFATVKLTCSSNAKNIKTDDNLRSYENVWKIFCRIHSLFLFFTFVDSLPTIAGSGKKASAFDKRG